MGTIRVHGASVDGMEAFVVTIEARFEASDEARGVEVQLTGLPDSILRESRGRIACALRAAGLRIPAGRVYLNLVPAGRRKSGEGLDLALVLAAATAAGHLAPRAAEGTLFLGEVGLDGRLHAVPGGLASTVAARATGLHEVVAPPATAQEAAALDDVRAFAAHSLRDVVAHLTHDASAGRALPRASPPAPPGTPGRTPERLDEVRGQDEGKLALQVAAAGGHALLFVGPPGAGKSMLARRLIDLAPAMSLDERVEVTTVLSATGRWPRGLASRRPFRAPHHTTSFAGLVGGGSPIAPGEVTLAHGGVLFLDELPEFGREALEALREPLEAGEVNLSRAARRTTLPARFQLVAAMNPCPCGYRGHARIPCHCPPSAVRRYAQRVSGPLLDRIDLRVALHPTPVEALLGAGQGRRPAERAERGCGDSDRTEDARGDSAEGAAGPASTGAALGAAATAAWLRAHERNGGVPNAWIPAGALDALAPLEEDAADLLERAAVRGALSARSIQSVRRVARTVADLREMGEIDRAALATALELRSGFRGGSA
ncbi:MAG: ATP-binding protein [Planctomycetota bacterium]